jgi:hypothetical protein
MGAVFAQNTYSGEGIGGRRSVRLNSNYREICPVVLPYAVRQKYFHTFDLSSPTMAPGFEDYADVVRDLCLRVGATTGLAHMTVDEKIVKAGWSQRRPKPHVDGCFMPATQKWGGGPGWLHNCNNIPAEEFKRMPIIIASSAVGARAWRGEFDGCPAEDGDLSHIELPEGEVLKPNFGYLLSADCIHESMIQDNDVQRTFLRIALPVDFQYT